MGLSVLDVPFALNSQGPILALSFRQKHSKRFKVFPFYLWKSPLGSPSDSGGT
jgi:hypothetical protein